MSFFTDVYQKTGFFYSLFLSFLYLPLILGILYSNQFIEYQIMNLIVFISFTITFITALNYKIILSTRNSNAKYINKYILVPINILIIITIFFLLPFNIDENIFLFSSLFIIIPWIIFFLPLWRRHNNSY